MVNSFLAILLIGLLVISVLPSTIKNRTQEKKRQIDKRAHALGMDYVFNCQTKDCIQK